MDSYGRADPRVRDIIEARYVPGGVAWFATTIEAVDANLIRYRTPTGFEMALPWRTMPSMWRFFPKVWVRPEDSDPFTQEEGRIIKACGEAFLVEHPHLFAKGLGFKTRLCDYHQQNKVWGYL